MPNLFFGFTATEANAALDTLWALVNAAFLRLTLAWNVTVAVALGSARGHALCVLQAATNIAAVVQPPANAPALNSGVTMRLTMLVQNTSGGVLATPIAFSGAAGGYRTTGAFTNPASGKARIISFVYNDLDGFWYEDNRSAGDIG